MMEGNDVADDDTKPCPVCGETIKTVAIKCRFCGTDLVAFAQDRQAETERILFVGRPAILYSAEQYVLSVLTLGIAYLLYWMKSRSIKYVITTQRVRIEHGLFSIVQDNVELFRIDHFEISKPVGMRMVGQSELFLSSSDPGFPTVSIYGIPNLEMLADELREFTLRERARRRITTFVQA